MAQLAVSRLHLRGPPALAFRATARAAEALRLAAPEGERLLVLRRLALGRLPVSGAARLWEGRAGAALRDAGARAVHAASPGAAAADAVWFASVAEARWLLLRELATGRLAEAWFWRLAVPDWRGATLADWVPNLAKRALAEPMAEIALACAVMRLGDEGLLAPVARALANAPTLPRAVVRARPHPPVAALPAVPAERMLARRAAALLERHPPAARRALVAALRARPPDATATRWLARLALLAVAPEAAAQRDLLESMIAAIIDAAASPASTQPVVAVHGLPGVPATPGPVTRAAMSPAVMPRVAEMPRADAAPPRAMPSASVAPGGAPSTTPHVAPAAGVLPVLPDAEHRSRGAGVLLLVRPLSRMGLPAWLDRHPALAAGGYARTLLCHVARRMRIPPEDPLFAMLGECDLPLPPSLDAWRIGLDRWLRRRARRRLADVARRPGWLSRNDQSLVTRFAGDAADLRLRRLALDVDPGWVPWLGLAIRYHFRDAPLP